jgi:2-enoate reductase
MTSISEDFVKNLLEHMGDWFNDDEQFQLARLEKKYYPYTHLFSPLQVNRLRIKNRIVMGPMVNSNMAEEFGRPNDKMIQYFTERARGGVGLITSGFIPIGHAGDPTLTEKDGQTNFPRITGSRTVFSGWRDLAESVHSYGSRFFIQLTPGMGRVGDPESLLKKHRFPVSASWNPNFYIPAIPCRPLTDGECKRIIKDAGQASADAKAMTIDGVYLHGHEGFLLEQMTNPAFNRRVLSHFSNWQTFGLEIVREIRNRVGPDYPIMYRIDLSLALNATYGERMAKVGSLRKFRHERQAAETLEYMANLVSEGVDLFDVDLGCYENWWLPHPPNSLPSGVFLPVSRLVKEFFAENKILSNAGLPVPVVAVGKLGYPDLAEKALRDEMCDMIMLARPLLADPQWANKAYAGRVDEICPCIGDQEACLNELLEGGHLKCSVNPRTGLEDVIPRELSPAETPRKVGIVGAGAGGILAAITASQRGHRVTLYEARERLGGWLVAGSVPKTKYEVGNYLTYLNGQVDRCSKEHGLTIKLNTTVTPESLKSEKFDALVVCSGAKPVRPEVEGAELPHVVQAVNLFLHPEWVKDARAVVVVGGGTVGCEVAHWLAAEYGKQVSVLEVLPHLMKGVCTANRGYLIHDLERRGAKLYNCTRVISIRTGSVTVARNISSTVPDPYITWAPLLPENIPNPLAKPIREEIVEETFEADLVVLAVGLQSDHSLFEACQLQNVAGDIIAIGDNFHIGRVFEAVEAGFNVGSSL